MLSNSTWDGGKANSEYTFAYNFFHKYAGSHFFMAHDDEAAYLRYRRCNIPPTIEQQWRLEMLDSILETLKEKRWDSLKQYGHLYTEFSILETSANIPSRLKSLYYIYFEDFYVLDTITQLVCAENLLPLLVRSKMNFFSRKALQGKICALLENMLREPLHVSDEFQINGVPSLDVSKGALRKRIMRVLSGFKNLN